MPWRGLRPEAPSRLEAEFARVLRRTRNAGDIREVSRALRRALVRLALERNRVDGRHNVLAAARDLQVRRALLYDTFASGSAVPFSDLRKRFPVSKLERKLMRIVERERQGLRAVERELQRAMLRVAFEESQTDGRDNVSAAARTLGIQRHTLYRLLRKLKAT